MVGDDSLYRPCIEPAAAAAAESQSFDLATVRSDNVVDQCVSIQQMNDSQLVGVPLAVAGGAEAPSAVALEVNQAATEAGSAIGGGGDKRKRGRPPKGQTAAVAAKPPPPKRKKEEEDVCFICFDGGSLVLCDRKGCPKAYHPACVKRDEAFFRSKAKWNCGWHICSVCRKAAHYMCYTCTYSLCKGCTKDADYSCVRGTMGFCTTCMRTIMLIENKEQANKELVQVDFDDKSSWEYLFKVYWIYLKEKLSLTLDELTQAKNPWKGVASVAYKQQLPHAQHIVNHGNGFISNGPLEYLELKKPKELEESVSKDCLSSEKPSNEKITEKASTDNGESLVGPAEWASKELLEFVAHMKNGDASVQSQFDVQALLLEYIKKNNLRDPRRKSQIICDLRLKNLFGKPRVGHIEMLKLLEFHFLIKEDSQKNAFIPAGIVGALASHFGSDENNENSLLEKKNKRRKTRKKVEERAPLNNLDEYAAIDVHNINLIYLQRNLMENLTEDEKFQDKVVGSIVRIRISTNDQKQDMYRLVQVVGTSKVAVPYKIGDKTVDIVLEVLNLDKKEAIAIDTISNHEFSEDECRRLRQSIRCGLVRRLTVGEIQKKAMELQAVRLNDRLEAEILKLNHLRDRASEKGHKKELRECVAKLQLLKTPEERKRRLCEIPEVHTDPKMNPDYDSGEDAGGLDDKKQDEYVGQKYSGFSRSGSRSITSKRKVKEDGLINSQYRSNQKRDASGLSDQAVVRSGPEISVATLESGSSLSSNSSETDKLWHYRDPNGKVQGPFSMLQLRKWSTTGYFPPHMRTWINDEQDDSVLLTDALNGHFHTAAHLLFNLSLPRQEVRAATDNRIYNSDVRGNEKGALQSSNTRVQPKDNSEFVKTDGLGSIASDCTTSVVSYKEMQPGNSQLLKDNNSCSDHSCHSLPPSNVRQTDVPLPFPGQGHGSEGSTPDPYNENQVSHGASYQITDGQSHENQVSRGASYQITDGQSHENQANGKSYLGQSSGQNWRSFPINLNLNEMDPNSGFSLVTKFDSSEQNGDMDIPELPSPTPSASNRKSEGQAAEKLQPPSSDGPAQTSDIPDIPGPTPKPTDENKGGQIAESKKPLPSKFVGQDSGRSWSSARLVAGGAQLPEIANEWGGYSPTPAKPPVEELSSGLVSVSSRKQPEAVGDHATPTSNIDPLAPTSASPPTCNASGWHGVVEPIEFSTLVEESMSDLLAEVDAMESQSGLPSPTSAMRCGDEMMKGCEHDYFGLIEDLNATPDPGKSDALSSTGDIQLPCRSTVTDEPVGAFLADAYDPLKRSSGHSSTSSEGETKSADVPANQGEAGSAVHPTPSRTMNRDITDTTRPPSTGVEAMDTGWGRVPEHVNLDWGTSAQGIMNVGFGTSQGMTFGTPNVNRNAYGGGVVWEGQRKYSGERYPGPRDWASQGGDLGYGRGRSFWNRQSLGGGGGGGGGGGYSRPPPKGQRVCKFYESGHCKKGASCGYLHP